MNIDEIEKSLAEKVTQGNKPKKSPGWYVVKYMSDDSPPKPIYEKLWYNSDATPNWWMSYAAMNKCEPFPWADDITEHIDFDFIASVPQHVSCLLEEVKRLGDMFDFKAYLEVQIKWSGIVFGQGPRTEGILKHIAKESDEVRAEPYDLEEWIDIVILAFDGAWRAGHSPSDIMAKMSAKQITNLDRKWHVPESGDEPVKHIEQAKPLCTVCGGTKLVFDEGMGCGGEGCQAWPMAMCRGKMSCAAHKPCPECTPSKGV